MSARLAALASLLLVSGSAAPAQPDSVSADALAWAERCGEWDDWDKPGPPFRIHGNTYYVGTCGISAILIVGERSMILIDSGTEAGSEIVLANIRALGFDPARVKTLLMSHEHHDHVGGMARLVEATGADLGTGVVAYRVMSTGQADPRDPQFGMHEPMTPAPVKFTLEDGTVLGSGDLRIQAVATPGHTPGAMSWQWQSCENGNCFRIVYADSLSPVSRDDYLFSEHPEYLAAYRASLEKLAALDCDILLTPHPSASRLRDRVLGEARLIDRDGCKAYPMDIARRLDERLAQEAGK